MLSSLLLCFLWGCPTPTIGSDADGDGWTLDEGDCDDQDPSANPDAPEYCDEVDNNCNGRVDEDAIDEQLWFLDVDGDGYGQIDDVVASCVQPTNAATESGDCDEGDPEVNPGAVEIWYDNVDQDCAEDDDHDADADGSRRDTDCDDADPDVHPNADEICGDGIDNDCSGTGAGCSFSGEQEVDTLTHIRLLGSNGMSAGFRVWAAGDLDGDGTADLAVGAPDSAGEVDLVTDLSQDQQIVDSAVRLMGASDEQQVGLSFAPLGDLDGNGYAEVGLSSRYASSFSGEAGGVAWVVRDAVLTGTQVLGSSGTGNNMFTFYGAEAGDYLGMSVAGLASSSQGPLLLVGAPGFRASAGAVLLVAPEEEIVMSSQSSGVGVITGERVGDELGFTVDTVDVDGDGVEEIITSSAEFTDGLSNVGAVYILDVLASPTSVDISVGDVFDAKLRGTEASDGMRLLSTGDFTGDGYPELFLRGLIDGGRIYLVDSGVKGSGRVDTTAGFESIVRVEPTTPTDNFGMCAGLVGDLDGDGQADIGMGSPNAAAGGEAYLFYGPTTGVLSDTDADATIMGASGDGLNCLAQIGDLDQNGTDELVVGMPRSNDNGVDSGEVMILFAELAR